MPSSKEVRARQNRQKERIAAAHAERQRVRQRRRRFGGAAGVIVIVIVVAVGLAAGNGGTKVAVTPPTETTTTVGSAKGKPCVGLKSPLPKSAPAMPLTAGPPPTKLETKDLKIGTGAVVPKNATVTVNFVGAMCSTGKIFDASYSTNQPIQANLAGGVIPGWQEGVPGMKVGGVRLLSIPSDLGYGPDGNPDAGIAPDEPLFFLVAAVKLG